MQGSPRLTYHTYHTYHKDIGFPRFFTCSQLPSGLRKLYLSRHAEERAWQRGITAPSRIDLTLAEVIEVSFEGQVPVKLLVRVRHPRGFLVLVLVPAKDGNLQCITLYINAADDMHSTLDETRYARPA